MASLGQQPGPPTRPRAPARLAPASPDGTASTSTNHRNAAPELPGPQSVDALTGRRYEDFRLDTSYKAWTPWFGDVAWDRTFISTDVANAELTVLCITDAD